MFYGQSQTVYNWINMQHIAGDLSVYPIKAYLRMEGAVKKVEEVSRNSNREGEVNVTKTTYRYFKNGYPDLIKQLNQDSSEFIFDYRFSPDWQLKYQIYSYIYSGPEKRDTIEKDTIYFSNIPLDPDSITYDNQKNVTYYRIGAAETYTFFDRHSRKIRDSIPGSGISKGHYMIYKYRRRFFGKEKIIRKEIYPDDHLFIKIAYKTDRRGNWVKCVIKSNRRWKNAVLTREIEYYD